MKQTNENQWLEPLLARYMYHEPVMLDFQQWAQRHPREAQLLERGFEDSGQSHKTKTYHIWRLIMESKITRYSAAAVVALAMALILLGPFWTSQRGGVLLADVQKKVAQVDTMILRGQKIFSSVAEPNISFDFDIVKYISKTYGYTEKGYIKDDLVYSITFNRPEKQTIILFPIWKKMRKFPFTEAQLKLMENLTPNGIIDLLLQSEYEELGTKEIDGIEVQGFEFQDTESLKGVFPKSLFNIEKCKGSVWVGVEELLPVRMEGDISIGKCLFTAFTDFNLHEVNVLEGYNIELDEEIFDIEIPEGYTEFKLSDILPFIPVKAKAGLAGLGAVPICLIVWKRFRRKKTTIMQ